MDSHDSRNVQRVLRVLAREWGYPVWMVKGIIQKEIDKSWQAAQLDPKEKVIWITYFPEGKPTAEQYILWLGHGKEKGEVWPYLLKDR